MSKKWPKPEFHYEDYPVLNRIKLANGDVFNVIGDLTPSGTYPGYFDSCPTIKTSLKAQLPIPLIG